MGKAHSISFYDNLEYEKQNKQFEYIGEHTIYRDKIDRNRLVADKKYVSTAFNCRHSDFVKLGESVSRLNSSFFSCHLSNYEDLKGGLCFPEMIKARVSFELSPSSLYKIEKGFGAVLPQESGFYLLKAICTAGDHLEQNLQFFPRVQIRDIFSTDTGLKFMNPFIYDKYVLNALRVC